MMVAFDKLQGRVGRDAYIPLSFRCSLKLEQVEWEEIVADPGLASFTLRAGQRLFKADGLVNWFDDWLEAETAGVMVERDPLGVVLGTPKPVAKIPDAATWVAARPVATVLDLTRRLGKEVGGQSTLLGYMTGGVTLLGRLYGRQQQKRLVASLNKGKPVAKDRALIEGALQLSIALANAYCEVGVGALLLVEHDVVDGVGCLQAFDALFNLAGYFGVPVVLLSRHSLDGESRRAARDVGVGYVIAPGEQEGGVLAVPVDLLAGSNGALASWVNEQPGAKGQRVFISDWEIPPNVAPENLIALQKHIAG